MMLDKLAVIVSNPIINSAFIGWFLAQLWKFLYDLLILKKVNFRALFSSGGMPRSHSSLVVSAAVMICRIEGITSTSFALAMVVAAVVMYDATGVRRQAGFHAKKINMIMQYLQAQNFELAGENLKELLGHTPFQVLAGGVLGLIVGLVMPAA